MHLTGFGVLLAAAEEGGTAASFWGLLIYVGFVLAIVVFTLQLAKRSFGEKVFKSRPAQLVEQVYVFIETLCLNAIGPHGKKYMPFIMTFWLVIFVSNAVSLFFADAPTADLSFNLAMALIAVGYVQWEGIKENGAWGHIKHFAGPKLGLAFIPITLLLFCIEIISELMKNVSLSLRLFGNIHGGHEAVETMNKIGVHIGGLDWLNVPVGAFLIPIKLLTVIVQALIFCLLTSVYLGMVTGHSEAHGEAATAH